MNILETITKLSREFSSTDYVRGGGGNTSCKDADTLWVKPSGTTLAALTPESFVAMDRRRLAKLYTAETPSVTSERETMVKEMMAAAVTSQTKARASVEAPLHDSLAARYVIHTHPALVNGLTCSLRGKEVAATLFPEALWVPYTDPGYTLSMRTRELMREHVLAKGKEPSVVILENHGVFVAAETAAEIRSIHSGIMQTLREEYQKFGIPQELIVAEMPPPDQVDAWRDSLRKTLAIDDVALAASGHFDVASGPISPDHLIYARSFPFEGVVTAANLRAFKETYGYNPRIVCTANAVLGVGVTQKEADLALEFAVDGALIRQLAKAFGGIKYLNDVQRGFIENWEVESYRQKQVGVA